MDLRAYVGSVRALLEGDSSDVVPSNRVSTFIICAAEDVMMAPQRVRNLNGLCYPAGALWRSSTLATRASSMLVTRSLGLSVDSWTTSCPGERNSKRRL